MLPSFLVDPSASSGGSGTTTGEQQPFDVESRGSCKQIELVATTSKGSDFLPGRMSLMMGYGSSPMLPSPIL
ncbi:unnamed protein product, partial [Amoebophrya sp. A25]|eukprot:GSA25T00022038001.1